MNNIAIKSIDEKILALLAGILANYIKGGDVVYCYGDLGAGKTTFVRMLLLAMGYSGRVKSPTFSIVEEYDIQEDLVVSHFDLYRIVDKNEVYNLGIADYVDDNSILLIEWPEKGFSSLPDATITINFSIDSEFTRNLAIGHYSEDFIVEASSLAPTN